MSKIAFILRRYCPEEAWTNRTLAYAKGLAECGADVSIYYLISDREYTKYSIEVEGVNIINLWESDGKLCRRYRLLSYIKNLLVVRKKINKDDSIFLYGGDYLQLKLLLGIRNKAKIFTEITEHPDIVKRTSLGNFILKQRNRLLNKIDGLFVISQSLQNYFYSMGIDKEKVNIINMFVDTNRFSDLKKETGEKYIAYCGTVSYGKDGVDTLIKAFSIFHKTHSDYKLKIIGRGLSQDVLPRLKKLAESIGINGSVEFTGMVDRSKMPHLLNNASILALARPNNLQSQNGFPTKLGEYLATGNPTLVTKVGEIPYFIKDGVNGFLALPDNPEDFAEKLSWIADNYQQALEIGHQGRKLVLSEFSYKTQSEKVFNIINQNH